MGYIKKYEWFFFYNENEKRFKSWFIYSNNMN